MIKISKKIPLALFTIIALFLGTGYLWACTRILSNNKFGVLVGRTMDWADMDHTAHKIIVLPRGVQRTGGTSENPLEWVSKYGSVAVSMYDLATAEGINEKGLGMSMLFLAGSDYGTRDVTRKALFASVWGQFFLDNFATVQEAVDYLNNNDIQIVSAVLTGPNMNKPVTLHVSLQDALGDSAIIEYEQGKAVVYHDAKHTVMTNDPFFREQLINLSRYQDSNGNYAASPAPALEEKKGFWSNFLALFQKKSPEMIPGYPIPRDRFVRASYYSSIAEEPRTDAENRKIMLGLMANVAQPMTVQTRANAGPETSRTNYTTLSDLTNLKLYMSMAIYHSLVSVDLNKLDFSSNQPFMMFDVQNIDTHGDVTNQLRPMAKPFTFATEDSFKGFTVG